MLCGVFNDIDSAMLVGPRQAVARAAGDTPGLVYTAPVLDAAAALLAELWAVCQRHGALPLELDAADQVLRAIDPVWRTGHPRTEPDAEALFRVLVEEFAALGVTVTFDPEQGKVIIPREAISPAWGYSRLSETPPQLAVTLVIEDGGGWLSP